MQGCFTLTEKLRTVTIYPSASTTWVRTCSQGYFGHCCDVMHASGHFLLTNLLMKHLLQSRDARVITVSSITHDVSGIDWEFVRSQDGDLSSAERYFLSKLANVLFAQELARRCSGKNKNSVSIILCYMYIHGRIT